MPTLVLARHAHATHDPMPDFDRHLTEEGEAEAVLAGRFLSQFALTHLVSSPAKRTTQTGQAVVDALNDAYRGRPDFKQVELQFEPALYNATVQTWLDTINAIPEDVPGAYIVGHNPIVWETVERVGGVSLKKFKPSSVAVFQLPSWDVDSFPEPTVRYFGN